ncbi:MAG: hypothetical protein SLAVMIC_00806 [uncultured marine phage]|uniref:Uncharacterized protein n=1 Tax=uncultured marine phage TaxID=707152 RepID=A0A8D9FR38_9VIRU|nr:MAG: hypothetical protein SLAVMIC_00806 [uncultured marine phage]
MIKKFDEFVNEEFFWRKKPVIDNTALEVNTFFGRMKAVENLFDMYRSQDPDFWKDPDVKTSMIDSSELLGDFMRSAKVIVDSMDLSHSEPNDIETEVEIENPNLENE